MELRDFEQQQLQIEDFKLDEVGTALNINQKSAAHLAAGEVLLSEEPTYDSYKQLKEELLSQEGREAWLVARENRRHSILNEAKAMMGDVLLSEHLTTRDKKAYVDGLKSADQSYTPSSLDLMIEEAYSNIGAEVETEEQMEARTNGFDLINESLEHRRAMAALINGEATRRDPNLVSSAVDIMELMTPFAEWIDTDQLYRNLTDGGYGEDGAWLMGSQREQLYDLQKKLPIHKRAELASKIIDFVNSHDTLLIPDGNDMVALHNLHNMLVQDDYSNTEKWVDNVVSVLEFAILPAFLKGGAKGATRATRTATNPVSPAEVIKDVNPEKARNMHDVIVADKTGEAAEALHGASKEESLAKMDLPEPEMEVGEVEKKVNQRANPLYAEPELIKTTRNADGRIQLTKAENKAIDEKVYKDFQHLNKTKFNVEELKLSIAEDGSTRVTAMYHPTDAGWRTPEEAMEAMKVTFRRYGVDDEHLQLYRLSGDKWVKTDAKLVSARKSLADELARRGEEVPPSLQDGGFAVGIDYNYYFNPKDAEYWETLGANSWLNVTDRVAAHNMTPAAWKQGSIAQNLFDPLSLLDPKLVLPALQKEDKAVGLRKLYVDLFEDFAKGYAKAGKESRNKLRAYIEEANEKGIRLSETDLSARGFDETEKQILREWRRGNDALYYAQNSDLGKTLSNQGYMVYRHEGSQTKAIVKPMKRGSVSPKTEYLDVVTGEVKRADSIDELDEFYKAGGEYVQLAEPVLVGDKYIDVMRANNQVGGAYTRAIKHDELVLNYREGYYPVKYDANFFIQERLQKADGTTFTKTIGSARTTQDALSLKKTIDESGDFGEVVIIPHNKLTQDGATQWDEMTWSLGVSSGMSAQRIRGERLIDASEKVNQLSKHGRGQLIDPLKAIEEQVHQLSRRTSMRNYLDSAKTRWLDNYAKDINLTKDKYGNYVFPGSIQDITGGPGVNSTKLASARSTYNYIWSLENAYLNLIDESFKGLFNTIGDVLAPRSAWAEGWVRDMSKGSATSLVKGAAFKMFLAANPQRQLIVQGHQNVQLAAINPTYMLKGGMAWDLYRLGRAMRGYTKDAEAVEMLNQIRRSGMMEAVDANNLVRQDMLRMADTTAGERLRGAANAPIKAAQRAGFDLAEQSVLTLAWLNQRDLALKSKKALTVRDYEDIAAKARAYTYAMNRAGDMPYNTNSLNIIAQFLQVPHKAMLQPFLNKNLTKKERLQLMTWNGVMYGLPAGVIGSMLVDMEEGPQKEALSKGLESVLLNSMFSAMTGEEQNVDWGDLVPTDLHGTSDFMWGLMTLDIGRMVAEAPATQLLFGGSSRLGQLASTTARYFHFYDDYDDPELDTKLSDVSEAAARLFSGYSNGAKALYAMKTRQKLSSMGNVTDEDITKFEAAMTAFGFRTEHEEGARKVYEKIYKGKDFGTKEANIWYKELKRHLARRNMTIKERDLGMRVLNEGLRAFEDEPHKFNQALQRAIINDIRSGTYDVFEAIRGQVGWVDENEVLNLLNLMPDSEQKRVMTQSVINLREARKGN